MGALHDTGRQVAGLLAAKGAKVRGRQPGVLCFIYLLLYNMLTSVLFNVQLLLQ